MSDQNNEVNTPAVLKSLSRQDLLNLGMREIAYIKAVQVQDRTAFAIHAADGTPLSVMDTLETALVAMRYNDLEAVTVH